eukprot:TRINITY_DN2185_c0_g1_i1.p1 TRINITY_DN2185_c0_g1~~TRINITY_DN2185_c0_g1_i1.p1  ORF type:complete len:324 (-),score=26.12 TRINITY_DN2185_c0_g1_i1:123-1094(-)
MLTCTTSSSASDSPHKLGSVIFAAREVPRSRSTTPTLSIHTQDSNEEAYVEEWTSEGTVQYVEYNGISCGYTDEYLFACVKLTSTTSLSAEVFKCYEDIFDLLRKTNHTQLLRMWNFVPSINAEGSEGLEEYRAFCKGRADAFAKTDYPMPAASGVGLLSGVFAAYFITRRPTPEAPVIHLENSLQMPAYKYPPIYGPRSPSFARATYTEYNNVVTLFVSGTASIRSHQSIGNTLAEQLQITLENISHLISSPNLLPYNINRSYTPLSFCHVRAYYRHRHDKDAIYQFCRNAFQNANIRMVHSDICRQELLVEIEGIIQETAK